MLVTLHAPYVDTTAAELSLTLGGPERPALHVIELATPRAWVGLRLLGASHQVVLRASTTRLTETVACLPGQRPELPAVARHETADYRFTAAVLRPGRAELSVRVAALCADLADDPFALVGVFPGDPDAVTALSVRPDGRTGDSRWRTWHAYPQTTELVMTETAVTLQ